MTVRTREELNSDAAARLPDNAGGEITPADVRQSVQDLADSAKLAEDLFGKQAIFIPAYGMVARTTNGARRIPRRGPASASRRWRASTRRASRSQTRSCTPPARPS